MGNENKAGILQVGLVHSNAKLVVQFTKRIRVFAHLRQKHPDDLKTEDNSDPNKLARCLGTNCGSAFRSRQELRDHLVRLF